MNFSSDVMVAIIFSGIAVLSCVGCNFILDSYCHPVYYRKNPMFNMEDCLIREVKRSVRFRIELFAVMFIPCVFVSATLPGISSASDKLMVVTILFVVFFLIVFALKTTTLFKKLNWAIAMNQNEKFVGYLVNIDDALSGDPGYSILVRNDEGWVRKFYIGLDRMPNDVKKVFRALVIVFHDSMTGTPNVEFISLLEG